MFRILVIKLPSSFYTIDNPRDPRCHEMVDEERYSTIRNGLVASKFKSLFDKKTPWLSSTYTWFSGRRIFIPCRLGERRNSLNSQSLAANPPTRMTCFQVELTIIWPLSLERTRSYTHRDRRRRVLNLILDCLSYTVNGRLEEFSHFRSAFNHWITGWLWW